MQQQDNKMEQHAEGQQEMERVEEVSGEKSPAQEENTPVEELSGEKGPAQEENTPVEEVSGEIGPAQEENTPLPKVQGSAEQKEHFLRQEEAAKNSLMYYLFIQGKTGHLATITDEEKDKVQFIVKVSIVEGDRIVEVGTLDLVVSPSGETWYIKFYAWEYDRTEIQWCLSFYEVRGTEERFTRELLFSSTRICNSIFGRPPQFCYVNREDQSAKVFLREKEKCDDRAQLKQILAMEARFRGNTSKGAAEAPISKEAGGGEAATSSELPVSGEKADPTAPAKGYVDLKDRKHSAVKALGFMKGPAGKRRDSGGSVGSASSVSTCYSVNKIPKDRNVTVVKTNRAFLLRVNKTADDTREDNKALAAAKRKYDRVNTPASAAGTGAKKPAVPERQVASRGKSAVTQSAGVRAPAAPARQAARGESAATQSAAPERQAARGESAATQSAAPVRQAARGESAATQSAAPVRQATEGKPAGITTRKGAATRKK